MISSAPTESEWRHRVTDLYKAFKPYLSGAVPEGCPCCVHKKDQQKLRRAPLEELTWSDLGHFAFKAMTTWGDADSFRHYLPRILELIDDNPPWNREILLGKLRLAEWRTWPEKEQRAVAGFLLMLWRRVIHSPDQEADEYLCAFVCAGCDMAPFLEAWQDCECAPGYSYLRDFAREPFTTAFWNQSYPEQQQVDRWLLSQQTISRLNAIFESETSADFSDHLAQAIDAVENYRARNRTP